jgi:DNA-binding response OmpR family regulator
MLFSNLRITTAAHSAFQAVCAKHTLIILKMKKILLIEDNLEVRENTSEILELAGYNVVTAPNGKIGVDLAQKENPDLIICDIMMPALDGYGVLHILSKKTQTAGITFIFLTAKTEKTDIRKGMNLGADDYLTKPFDDTELLNAIEARLRKAAMQQQLYDTTPEGLDNFISDARKVLNLKDLCKDKKVAEEENQLLNLAYNSVRQRTAEALLKVRDLRDNKENIQISREDLAKMVGTASESIIRVLSEFKDEGLIEI